MSPAGKQPEIDRLIGIDATTKARRKILSAILWHDGT
jgi:hypothetical protein